MKGIARIYLIVFSFFLVVSCTFETRNKINRSLQNWTGVNGVVDVFSEGKVMYRFIEVEKMTTAAATGDRETPRTYRYGYGVMDLNQNYRKDNGEKKVYFEVSEGSTPYVFYESPIN